MNDSRTRTRLRRSFVVALLATGVMVCVPAASVNGQSSGGQSANTVVSTLVGGVFGFSPALPTLTQNSQTGNLCSPGACFVGSVTTRGNRGWQLQVKLASQPVGFTVRYVQTTVPASAQAVNSGVQTLLTTATWLTVATGALPTGGSVVGVMFNANRTSGNSGVQPSAAQVAAVVTYQVVAFP